MSRSLIALVRGRIAGGATALAFAFVLTVTSAQAAAKRAPDLVLGSLAEAPATKLSPGSTFSERFTERNAGSARAPRSKAVFYLSPSATLGHGATLIGKVNARALRPRQRIKQAARLTIPAGMAAGSYFLIGCTGSSDAVRARNAATLHHTRTRCRAAGGRVTVNATARGGAVGGGGGGGGSSGGGSSPVGAAPCMPIAVPELSSTSARCFDGDVADAVFVSGIGADSNPGTMAAPKRTLAAGIKLAAELGRDVYVTEGEFQEPLGVADGVSVYGGYDASWQRSPVNETKITGFEGGTTEAASAFGIGKTTTLQLLTLEPRASLVPGGESFGLRGAGSPALILDHVTVRVPPGREGSHGSNGAVGRTGGNGVSIGGGGAGGAGGRGGEGHSGGEGGYAGYNGLAGNEGKPGLSQQMNACGNTGGFGGLGGKGGSHAAAGGRGEHGGSGCIGEGRPGGGAGNAAPPGIGLWISESGQWGTPGSSGEGGGGGGAGGSEGCEPCNGGAGGGGGGGGEGGGAGGGGQGGGGSFGIFLETSVGAMIRASSVTVSDGGAGGGGGEGGFPGPGGEGGAGGVGPGGSPGGRGGNGGPGALGGEGGGGAGGPSIAIFGLPSTAAPGTIVSHAEGGAGGGGGSAPAATGIAADYYP